jgi:hypothetical protein
MKAIGVFLATVLFLPSSSFGETKEHKLQMSLNDTFVVKDSEKWRVTVDKVLPLRYGNVKVLPKKGYDFSLMLYFKCDTPDLAQFDSFEKMDRSILASSQQYLPDSVEKKVEIKRLNVKGWYGCSTVLTDKDVAGQKAVPPDQFKYMTRGMVRLSPDSALGFSLMTNQLDSPQYKELMDYVFSFVKPSGTQSAKIESALRDLLVMQRASIEKDAPFVYEIDTFAGGVTVLGKEKLVIGRWTVAVGETHAHAIVSRKFGEGERFELEAIEVDLHISGDSVKVSHWRAYRGWGKQTGTVNSERQEH